MNKPDKLSIRPKIDSLTNKTSWSKEEQFQNETLRPIIKLQHDLLIAFFNRYVKNSKILFEQLTPAEKKALIANRFKQDHRLKLELRGFIVGQFTIGEYNQYQIMAPEIHRRMISIIQERLISTL